MEGKEGRGMDDDGMIVMLLVMGLRHGKRKRNSCMEDSALRMVDFPQKFCISKGVFSAFIAHSS